LDALTTVVIVAGSGSLLGLEATGGMEVTALGKTPVTDLEDTAVICYHVVITKARIALSVTDGDSEIE